MWSKWLFVGSANDTHVCDAKLADLRDPFARVVIHVFPVRLGGCRRLVLLTQHIVSAAVPECCALL